MEALEVGFDWFPMAAVAAWRSETPFEGYLSWVGVFGTTALICLTSGSFSESDGSKDHANVNNDYHFGWRLGTK